MRVPAPWSASAAVPPTGATHSTVPIGGAAPTPGPYQPGYAYPAPAPPRRRRTGLIVGLSITGAVLVLLACGGVGVAAFVAAKRAAATRSLPTPEVSPSAVLATGSPHTGTLRSYAVPAPAGSRPWHNLPADQDLTLDQAAALSSDKTARAEMLRRYGFQRGFIRHWVTGTGAQLVVRLYQFSSTDLASEFYLEDVTVNSAGSWGTPTDVPGVPGGKSFTRKTPLAGGYAVTMGMGLAGDIVVVVMANQLPPPNTAVSNQVLSDQMARL